MHRPLAKSPIRLHAPAPALATLAAAAALGSLAAIAAAQSDPHAGAPVGAGRTGLECLSAHAFGCTTPNPEDQPVDGVRAAGLSGGVAWPQGVVPYRFDPGVTPEHQAAMVAALGLISAKVAVQFVPYDGEVAFITIRNGALADVSSSSAIGRTGAEQFLNIGSLHWARPGILVHETCHALGLYHEQQRSDRANFVTIVTTKVQSAHISNFNVISSATRRGGYDLRSIMHYGPAYFSTDGDLTIEVRPPYRIWHQYTIGAATELSPGDIYALRDLYPGGPTPPPGYFDFAAPADGMLLGAAAPTFAWTASPNAESYSIEIARDRTFTDIVHAETTTGTSIQPSVVLAPNRVYLWRVKASNAQGTTDIYPIPSRLLYTADQYPAVLYVDASASPEGNGLSWGSPMASLQEALEIARASRNLGTPARVTEIRVARGLYTPNLSAGDRQSSFVVSSGLALRGGYAGLAGPDPDLRDLALHPTILSGDLDRNDTDDPASRSDNSDRVVDLYDTTAGTVLDGLTIRAGQRFGLRFDKAVASVVDCTVADTKPAPGVYAFGADVLFGSANVTFDRCVFIGNGGGPGFGGAISVNYRNAATIRDCVFVGNTSLCGGAVAIANANVTITDSIFVGNFATATAPPYVGGGAVSVALPGTSVRITNCTMASNSAATGASSIATFDGITTQIFNTIVRDALPIASGGLSGVNNDIRGGLSGLGNFDADPLFRRAPSAGGDLLWGTADDDRGDLRLAPGSPCINTGRNTSVPAGNTLDLAGETRVLGAIVDIGAYEFRCPADLNRDGVSDPDDLADYIACFFTPAPCPEADFNRDGVTDPDDLSDYISAFFGGAC